MAEAASELKMLERVQSPWRNDFPILRTKTQTGKPLAFLDTAASAQKPKIVIDAMNAVLEGGYSNIHRGLYEISLNLSQAFEDVRDKVATFIGAPSDKNIVFTRNATEGINLVAQSWGKHNLQAGDEVIITEMEHHANIVPWQILASQIGIVVKVIPVTKQGTLDIEALENLLTEQTRYVGAVSISNALGTINHVNKIVNIVRSYNADIKILIDGSQSIVHGITNVIDLDCDFLVFTGHKIYGPSGIGVLYGKYDLLQSMPPYQGGGDMIETVSLKGETTFRDAPYKFEAGTPAIVDVIGLGAALTYVGDVGMDKILEHERALSQYAHDAIMEIEGLTLHGPSAIEHKAGILSFTMNGIHSSDIGMILDQCGVAVRTGHHCAMPLMEAMGLESTTRASIGMYTNQDDIDALILGLKKVQELFS